MARGKQWVFSARTTEEGLRRIGELKASMGVSWDEMVIDAVSAHYGLDKAALTLPKKSTPAKEGEEPPNKRRCKRK